MDVTPLQTHPRIAIVICYFGKKPWYFEYFAKSCSYNPDVDFMILTDIKFTGNYSKNIIFIDCSIDEIKERARKKMQLELCLDRAYKLCDLKPAFGVLFSDYLAGYDFWGHGDIDIIFGNIRSFITRELLEEYDVISVRKEYISGFFALFRNNEVCNNLFKQSRDYKKVFQNPTDYCFDECNWEWLALIAGKSIFDLNSEVESMTEVVKKMHNSGRIKALFKTIVIEYTPGKMEWNRGELIFDKTQKALLYHLLSFKRSSVLRKPRWRQVPDRFFIHKFYFSKLVPGSIAGRIMARTLGIHKMMRWYAYMAVQYMKWFGKYLVASKKIKYSEIDYLNKWTGNYRRGKLIVSIQAINDRPYAILKNKEYRLLHRRSHTFFPQTLYYDGLTNIDLEFCYDPVIEDYHLKIKSSGHEITTMFKVTANLK